VNAGRLGLNVYRPEVTNGHRFITAECRVPVRNDPNLPRVAFGYFECRCGPLVVTRAEGARPQWVGIDLFGSRREIGGPLASIGNDGHPSTSKRIETKLAHRYSVTDRCYTRSVGSGGAA
jgi:hypothetical protein